MILRNTVIDLLFVLFLILSIAGCREERPNGVLSDDEMEKIIYELYMTDGALGAEGIFNDTVSSEYYNSVFNENGITKERFDSTLKWYSEHLEDFERVTENVSLRIEKERDR